MKKFRVLCLLLAAVLLLSCIPVSAAAWPPADSDVWKNLTDTQATQLLTKKAETFVFCFYRETCGYSKNAIPKFIDYARENNLVLCGLNETDYPNFTAWARYLKAGQKSITFPMVIACNIKEGLIASEDNVQTVGQLIGVLEQIRMTSVMQAPENLQIFTDIPADSVYYEATKALAASGVLSGYSDGTFQADGSLTRAEAAAVIARAGLLPKSTAKSVFYDVADSFWGKEYIMAAYEAKVINGMGGGKFAPQELVTRYQFVKMMVCLAGFESNALSKGGWPLGYCKEAVAQNFIDAATGQTLEHEPYGNRAISRGEVALWTYDAAEALAEPRKPEPNNNIPGNGLITGGKNYELGMSASVLGTPVEICPSNHRFDWYVFGTKDYKSFFAAGVREGKIVALTASGPGFVYKGYRPGSTVSGNMPELLTDKNDNNIVHGVFLLDEAYAKNPVITDTTLEGESKMIFHLTNGFRLYHGLTPLTWDEKAATAARMHSADMATNNYFNHTSLDGRKTSQRLSNAGISWSTCAENIAAGYSMGVTCYNGWVNSGGHRKNMLGNYTYLGVGTDYNKDSDYRYYATQNFFG